MLKLVTATAISAMATVSVWADVTIIEYNIANYANVGSTTLAPSIYDPLLLASDEAIPEPLTMWGLGPMNSGTQGLSFARQWPNGTKDNNIFFEFRLTVPGGLMTEPKALTYSIGREAFAATGIGMNRWELHWSNDQFDQHDEVLEIIDSSSVADYFTPSAATAMTINTDLSGMGEVTEANFRWYAFGGTGAPSAGFIDRGGYGSPVTLVTENGIVPIPEPAALVSTLALAGLLVRRRR